MPPSNHHIILRQVFELEFPAGVDGFAMQQEIGNIVREKLLPRIEALFDRFAGADELIRIDKLELDIGRIPPADLEETLMRSVMKQLEEKLEIAVINAPPGVERLPVGESHFAEWLFFLENGYLSGQTARIPETQFQIAVLEQLASATAAVERFRRLVQNNPSVLVRLVRQHAEPFLVNLLETLTAFSQRTLPDYRREMLRWIEDVQSGDKRLIFNNLQNYASERFVETFWLALFGFVLKNAVFTWTAENLFAGFLQYFAASAGPQQAPLLIFWGDIARQKKTPYPLLKRAIGRHPELLNLVENRTQSEKKASENVEIQGGKTLGQKPLISDNRPEVPAGETAVGPRQEASTFLDPNQTLRQEPVEGPETELPEALSEPRQWSVSAKEQESPEETRAPASVDPEQALLSGDIQQHPGDLVETQERSTKLGKPVAENSISARTGDFWYINNAGVVLLHPFLSPFFKTAGLVDKGNFIDEAAQHKAVHLLHFLATGQTQPPEYDLVLPRFLCGLPFDVPLLRFVDIPAKEQEEGEKLLQAAIQHWNKLGSTSPDGLRDGFLQRDGKLEKREPGWYLCVDQKTIDILLDFLPWNLSMIKLPWMPELLRVEWA